jgi:photosystem II stability/assembly factor-like uncharacterized protein
MRRCVALVCVLLAGCGAGATHTTARARRAASVSRCAGEGRLGSGALDGWRMGAVQFSSAEDGIGVSAYGFPCWHRTPSGETSSWQREPAQLATTHDGGRTWQPEGAPIPRTAANQSLGTMVVAVPARRVWALVADRLFATDNAGASWQAQALPAPVVQIAAGDGFLWALSCPMKREIRCTPTLERMRTAGTAWRKLTFPRLTSTPDPQLAVTQGAVIVQVRRAAAPGAELVSSGDEGASWTVRPDPVWDGRSCLTPANLTTDPTGGWWLICIGSAAAGSSTKGLLHTTDHGRHWVTVSQVRSLQTLRPHTIPTAEPDALAAPSRTRLWYSGYNSIARSDDGGRRWTGSSGVNPEGATTYFDALSPTHVWLIAPGAGLWSTTDGIDWHPVGPLNTG